MRGPELNVKQQIRRSKNGKTGDAAAAEVKPGGVPALTTGGFRGTAQRRNIDKLTPPPPKKLFEKNGP